jgi:signal transduction histidine kinase
LTAVIRDYIGKISSQTIRVELKSTIDATRFSSDVELHAYRIIQEVFANALKHSKCSKISVDLNSLDDLFTLKITDDGIGFDQNRSTGMGLLNITLRAEMIDFDLSIESSNQGTTILMNPKTTVE